MNWAWTTKTYPFITPTAAEDHRRLNGGVEMVLQKTSHSREELLDQPTSARPTWTSPMSRRRLTETPGEAAD